MRIEPTGEVIVARIDDNLYWEWRGGEIIWVTKELIETGDECHIRQEGQFLIIGPYRLRLIYEDHWRNLLVYHLDSPRAGFIVAYYRLLLALERLNAYVLRLLCRCRLVRCEEGVLLSWPVEVSLKLRPLWKRYLLLPRVWWGHYLIFRNHHGRLRSAYLATMMARLIVKPIKKRK